MNNLKRREELKEEEYQGIFGVTKATFDKMLLILEEAYKQRHSKGGSPLKNLSVLDKLIITLGYYREYRTMRHIAFDYGVSKSMVHKSIHWVEDVLNSEQGVFLALQKKSCRDKRRKSSAC